MCEAFVSPPRMKVALVFALIVMSFSSAKSEVRVVRDDEGIRLVRDGQAYFIKSGGGNEQAMKSIAAAGGIRSGFGGTIILVRR